MALPELESLKIAVIGLGYVGLPLAVSLGRYWPVLGFDINAQLVAELNRGRDPNGELDDAELAHCENAVWTTDDSGLAECQVFIVAVPTPVNRHHYPDLNPLESASQMIGSRMQAGSVVIFESTVYPGATEEICVPILEQASGLRYNHDFSVGYSPERINPGDKTRRLEDIVKVTSGSTPEASKFIDALYRKVIHAGTFLADSIRVAEAAKAIENTQRDLNIAFVNELAMMFDRMGLNTESVLAAAASKWNFLNFKPGLVGGHCIGVDPYYLIHKAQEHGYHPELILAARRINNGMAAYVTTQIMRLMALKQINIVNSRVLVLGLAFKENCADLRNTQTADIIRELEGFHAQVDVFDPWVDSEQSQHEFGITPIDICQPDTYDTIIVAVAHDEFREMGESGIEKLAKAERVIYDIKQMFPSTFSDGRL